MQTFPLVEVAGSSYEMGRQHGLKAGDLVHKYLRWIEVLTGKDRRELCRNALALEPFIRRLSSEYLEEVRGLSDGAGISYDEALLCQARGEAAHAQAEGCTAFALTGSATADGRTLAGQNQDLPPEFSDVAIILRVVPNDGRPRALMFTFAGQLGYMGMNQHGVAHFANALYNFTWRPGLPHYPLKRVLFEKYNVSECLEVVRSSRMCSPANMVFCDATGAIADVEIRHEGTAVYNGEHPDCRLHANHYATSEFAPFEDVELPDSCNRLDRFRALVKARWGSIDVAGMKEVLADHAGHPAAICRHGDRNMHSIVGYIAEPSKGLLHIRKGHGCIGTWTAYEV